MRNIIFFLGIIFLLAVSLCSAQEELSVTTYYPSPHGVYDELRSKKMAIGDTWFESGAFPWDTDGGNPEGNEIRQDANLVVEGNVGIGTQNPRVMSKLTINPVTSGSHIKLDCEAVVADIYTIVALLGDPSPGGTIIAAPHYGGATAPFHLWYWNQAYLTWLDAWRPPTDPIGMSAAPGDDIVYSYGNVGIGPYIPLGKFEVNPDDVYNNGDEFVVQDQGVGSGRVRVGIGTTTPSNNVGLDVRNSESVGNRGQIITDTYWIRNTTGLAAVPPGGAAWIDYNNDELFICRFDVGPAGNQGINFVNPRGFTRMSIMEDGDIIFRAASAATAAGNVISQGETFEHQGANFVLGTNDGMSIGVNPLQRALVHDDCGGTCPDTLVINFNNDFEGGVRIDGLSLGYEIVSNSGIGSDVNITVSCPAGKKVLGGGCEQAGCVGCPLYKNRPDSDTIWACKVGAGAPPPTVTAYAICAAIQ